MWRSISPDPHKALASTLTYSVAMKRRFFWGGLVPKQLNGALLFTASAALFLAGCGSESVAPDQATQPAIVLECAGQGANQEPISYLIKLHPGNQFQTSLHYYSASEARWVSPCQDNGFSCSVVSGPDLIEELGVKGNNPETVLRRVAVINRKTGLMNVELLSELPPITIFKGSCEKGVMPPDRKAKF